MTAKLYHKVILLNLNKLNRNNKHRCSTGSVSDLCIRKWNIHQGSGRLRSPYCTGICPNVVWFDLPLKCKRMTEDSRNISERITRKNKRSKRKITVSPCSSCFALTGS